MPYFDHKDRELFYGRHLIGTIIFAAGIVNMLSPLFWESKNSLTTTLLIGAGASLVGLFFMTAYDGKLVDFKGNRFKAYSSMFGFKSGKWKTLPPIESVKLLTSEEEVMNEPNGVSPTLTTMHKVYVLSVYSKENSKPEFTLRYTNKKKARKDLDLINRHLA